jgi:hypothetical protein
MPTATSVETDALHADEAGRRSIYAHRWQRLLEMNFSSAVSVSIHYNQTFLPNYNYSENQ